MMDWIRGACRGLWSLLMGRQVGGTIGDTYASNYPRPDLLRFGGRPFGTINRETGAFTFLSDDLTEQAAHHLLTAGPHECCFFCGTDLDRLRDRAREIRELHTLTHLVEIQEKHQLLDACHQVGYEEGVRLADEWLDRHTVTGDGVEEE